MTSCPPPGMILMLVAFALVVVLGIVLSACGGSSNGWPPGSVAGMIQSAERNGLTADQAKCSADYIVAHAHYPVSQIALEELAPAIDVTCHVRLP